jgi:adenylyltransferase/sulfurtransferase
MRDDGVQTAGGRRDPDCPVCGDHPSITAIDYEQFCGIAPAAALRPPASRPSSRRRRELKTRMDRRDDI